MKKIFKNILADQHTLLIKFMSIHDIHETKPVLIHNKPIYIRFPVLDLSKWKMYDFHYNFIKKNFYAELLFTDRDSLPDEIKSKDVYEEFFKWKDLFVFSNYSKVF